MGKLKINIDRIVVFLYLLFMLAFPYYANTTYLFLNFLTISILAFYITFYIKKYKAHLPENRILINQYTIWLVSITVLMLAASFWSGDFSASMSKTRMMFFVSLGQIALLLWAAEHKERLKFIIDISILIATVVFFKVVLTTPFSAYGNQVLFHLYTGYDKNGFAMMGAFLSICALLMFYKNGEKKYILGWAAMAGIAIVGGSRKGALIAAVVLPMFVLLKNKFSKKILYAFGFIIIGILVIYFVMTNSTMYALVGERLYYLFSSFFDGGNGDGSIQERSLFIRQGLNLFEQKKLLGWGTDGFAIQQQARFGVYVYSHCNYVELLCDYGIIGIILYYAYYIKVIVKTMPNVMQRNENAICSFIIFVLFAVFEYGMVSYFEPFYNFIKTLAIISLTCIGKENNNKYLRDEVKVKYENY